MKIGPLFKWFGSKWQAAKRYEPPRHNIVVEPFAGGAGYSLNYCDKQVRIWEDDCNLKVLWPWLIQEATTSDIMNIPINLPIGMDIRKIGLSEGQGALLKHWQRTNNVGDCWTVSPWGHLPGQWTANTRARVADQIGAIKHWKFVRHNINTQATYFIDPPYLYNYRYSNKLPYFDHRSLNKLVQFIHPKSLIIVCEAARKIDGVVPDYLPFVASHSSVTSRRKSSQSHHSNEVVYVRYPQ